MAAYGSVVSLLNLMDQVKQHQVLRHKIHFFDEQLEALRQTAQFLQDFLEGFSHGATSDGDIFEGQIATAALAVRDAIKSHMVDQVRVACTGQRDESSVDLCDLQKMIADMDSIKATAMDFQEKSATKSRSSFVVNKSIAPPSADTAIVGLDEQVVEIMGKLTGQRSSRQVLPIVGMGGIGKTTLARAVYENRRVVEYFDTRIWVTVSQDYRIKEILLQALNAINPKDKYDSSESEEKLALRLHKSLYVSRYLVVMDDIWSLEAWDKINRFFPKNNEGSGILITSRLSNMCDNSCSDSLKMQFFDEDKSWKLFCIKVFGSESCPHEFEVIGKKIVGKCRGLPLSIAVIGGLLAKSPRSQQYWESVEKDMNSIWSSENGDKCLDILSLSYQHLPQHLKPCFLYLGTFREDQLIMLSPLFQLWVAEGFLKPIKGKSMEEVAMEYLRDLIDRNLVLGLETKNRHRACSLHDLLREVSLRIVQKEKFICVLSMHVIKGMFEKSYFYEAMCRYNIPWDDENEEALVDSVKYANRALYHLCKRRCTPVKVNNWIWSVTGRNLDYSTDLFLYTLLSFPCLHFAVVDLERVVGQLYNFWNVQTLIMTTNFSVDSENGTMLFPTIDVWKIPQIRHILVHWLCLPEPPVSCTDESVLENLQTLEVVRDFRCTEQVIKTMPNIKILKIENRVRVRSPVDYCLNNVGKFSQLETFTCELMGSGRMYLALPMSLKNLILRDFILDGNELKLIAELPKLEFLILNACEFVESEWKIVEWGFQSLKCFKMTHAEKLTHLTIDASQNLPVLERLCLGRVQHWSEIPDGIADIQTLKLIVLEECSLSMACSAVKILEEQLDMGYEDLRVIVVLREEKERVSLRDKVGIEALDKYQKRFQILGRCDQETYWEKELDEFPHYKRFHRR